MTFVGEMLDLCEGTRMCVGSLFWSLRSHAEEGGFHWHRESGGDIVSLHWPGFTLGSPNYETEIFARIREVNGVPPSNDPTAYPLAPPILEQLPNSSQFSPPCASFRGSTGAQFYELWARDNKTEDRAWVVVSEGVSDAVSARSSFVSMDPRILTSRLGKMGEYDLCLRACAGINASRLADLRCHDSNASSPLGDSCAKVVRDGCSECSGWLTIDMSALLPGAHPACASLSFAAFDSTTYYMDEISLYFAHSEVAEARFVLIGLAGTTAALMLAALVGCRYPPPSRWRAWIGGSIACRPAALRRSLFRLLFVDAAVIPVPPSPAQANGPPRVVALDILRMLAVIWVAGGTLVDVQHGLGSLNAVSPRLSAALSYGVAGYPLLFLTSGFCTAWRYSDRAPSLPVWPLLRTRIARMYPAFLATALVGCAVQHAAYHSYLLDHSGASSGAAVSGIYILMMPFCLSAWHPLLRLANAANAPSFIVGALLLNTAWSLPILARLVGASSRSLCGVLCLTYAATLWQAASDAGITVLVLDRYVTFLALGASLPSYVFGLALGLLHLRSSSRSGGGRGVGSDGSVGGDEANRGDLLHALGAAIWQAASHAGLCCLVAVAALACTFAPSRYEIPRILAAWLRAGACLPLFAAALIAACNGQDPLAKLLAFWPRSGASLLRLWLPLLLCVHPAWRLAQLMLDVPVAFPSTIVPVGDWAVVWASPPPPPPPPLAAETPAALVGTFFGILVGGTTAVEFLVRRPSLAGCAALLDTLVGGGAGVATIKPPGSDATRGPVALPWERLVSYYLAMACTFGIFLSATFSIDNAEWALIANLLDAPAPVQRGLELTSWLLVMPALALLMGLLGQLLFPACHVEPVPPIPLDTHSRTDGTLLPCLYWRIVTRGMHPDLVASNVVDAFDVLERSGLPRARWEVEVVTDNAMDLAARTALDVVEIVVPSAYKPANGCKFKARALHYAAACGVSAARRMDWIVHMDEETRFNAATVAHVLHHCKAEHALWASGHGHAAIGQGVILYNVTAIESTLCALADTIRVGDDYGKFALQYRCTAQPLIGMHGSFVVCQAGVEVDFGFDHGIEGSITEDTFFAMHVRVAQL